MNWIFVVLCFALSLSWANKQAIQSKLKTWQGQKIICAGKAVFLFRLGWCCEPFHGFSYLSKVDFGWLNYAGIHRPLTNSLNHLFDDGDCCRRWRIVVACNQHILSKLQPLSDSQSSFKASHELLFNLSLTNKLTWKFTCETVSY